MLYETETAFQIGIAGHFRLGAVDKQLRNINPVLVLMIGGLPGR